jgi:CBS domain-containing protein
MVILSELLRFRLTDGKERGKLADLAVAILDEDYPPVTHLYYRVNGGFHALPWEEVVGIDWRGREIKVGNLEAGAAVTPEEVAGMVLLGRDVLDALLLDLQNRRAARANDLWLEEEKGRLLLKAADTTATGVLRRLSRGRYGGWVNKKALSDWRYMEFLRGDPQAVRNGAGYHLRITRLPPGEIAHLAELIPYLHAAELITLLPERLAANTLDVMLPERQLQIFEELDEAQGLALLGRMSPNIAADVIGRLETSMARRYLNGLPLPKSEQIVELLRYPEDTVGGIMNNEVVAAPAHLTVAEAREVLQEPLREPAFVQFVYVINDEKERQLKGVVSLRDLLVASELLTLEQVMKPYLVTLQPLEAARTAAYRVIDSSLAALPVVGDGGRLLGAVTVDAAVSLVAPPSWSAQAPKVFS